MTHFLNRAGALALVLLAWNALAGNKVRAAQSLSPQELSGSRPNFVVIMVDDLDMTTLTAASSLGILPNLERHIFAKSINFRSSFVSNPLCTPSRATFLTGQYTHNHRVFSNSHVSGSILGLDESATLPVWLQAAGYRTALVGKYLNAYGGILTETTPETVDELRAQFDAAVGPQNRAKLEPEYVPPGWSDWYGIVDYSTYCVYNYTINENGVLTEYLKNGDVLRDGAPLEPGYGTPDNYQTDVLARRAAGLLDDAAENPGQPFFLYVTPLAPHIENCTWSNERYKQTPAADDGPVMTLDEYRNQFEFLIRPAVRHADAVAPLASFAAEFLPQRPSHNEQDFTDKPPALQTILAPLSEHDQSMIFRQFANRAASMMAVDDLVGELAQKLEESDQLDNTVIIFTSDNGWFYGEHRLSGKELGYEEALRAPLYVRMPLGSKRETWKLALNNDLAPTITDLAGATPTITPDGRSLAPVLAGLNPRPWRERFLFEHFQTVWPETPFFGIHQASVLGVRTAGNGVFWALMNTYPGVQYRDGYRLMPPGETDELGFPLTPPDLARLSQSPLQSAELYDLEIDPDELTNLLYRLDERPPAQALAIGFQWAALGEALRLLANCAGGGCRTLESGLR